MPSAVPAAIPALVMGAQTAVGTIWGFPYEAPARDSRPYGSAGTSPMRRRLTGAITCAVAGRGSTAGTALALRHPPCSRPAD